MGPNVRFLRKEIIAYEGWEERIFFGRGVKRWLGKRNERNNFSFLLVPGGWGEKKPGKGA